MKKTNFLALIFILFIMSEISFAKNTQADDYFLANSLKVEGQAGWIVTDVNQMRLSWENNIAVATKKITGYEVTIAKNREDAEKGISSIWESGFLPIENGPYVQFDASKLPSHTEVWWYVRPVLSDKSFGKRSTIASFEIGLKNEKDWTGKWIGMNTAQRKHSAPLFRKSFEIKKPVLKARLYVCGLGYHESWLNGTKLGDEVLQPAQTDYNIRCFYVAHDLTKQLIQGENVLGCWLGDGFYNQDRVWGPKGMSYGEPRLKAQLEITYKDGSISIISTDESWQCTTSAVLESNIYAGEKYDATLYDANWATMQNKSDNWQPVALLASPGGKLVAQELQPCRRLGTVSVKKVSKLRSNTWVLDFGQNLVGWAKLKVNATPGTIITIRFGEDVLSNGELNFASSGVDATKVIQTDVYTCKGGGFEIWEPRFSYHGFRFAEMTISNGSLINKTPTKDILEGIVVHTDMEVVGEFSSSDETLNRAFSWAHWTEIGGVQGVPTDCPIRERCGWTGDAHNIVPYTMYRFDATMMWNKYVKDIVTTAQASTRMLRFGKGFNDRTLTLKVAGIPTMIAPGKRSSGEASPDWGSALAFIPWDVYVRSGDIRSLAENYSSILLWAEHLQKLSTNGIVSSGLGDWCKPIRENSAGKPDSELYGAVTPMLSTACYYRSVRILADAAKLLKNEKDFVHFDSLATTIRNAFTNAFYSKNRIMIPDQTINAIAIGWNILAPEFHPAVAKTLAEQVEEAGFHFMTGVFGMPSLWPTLCKFGYQQTAWKALQVESAPSLKYLAKRGATTFWEVWPMEKTENVEYSRSMSHPFQGGFVAWFFEGLAGISPDNDNPGYRIIHLEPQLIEGLDWVKCRFKSPMGPIESSWTRNNSKLIWTVEIPLGATAELRIPGKVININGASKVEIQNTKKVSDAMGKAERITLGSGKYKIESEL